MSTNTNKRIAVISDIRMNGINTSIHEIIPKPPAHSPLSKNVNTIITQNLKKD